MSAPVTPVLDAPLSVLLYRIMDLTFEDAVNGHRRDEQIITREQIGVVYESARLASLKPAERERDAEKWSECVGNGTDPSVGAPWMRCSPDLPKYVARIEAERQALVEVLREIAMQTQPELVGYSKDGEKAFRAGWNAGLNAVYASARALLARIEEGK